MANISVPNDSNIVNPFMVAYTTEAGENTSKPVRPLWTRDGLVIHRAVDSAHQYSVSHLHTGKRIVGGFTALRTAFEFFQALAQVYDFDALKDENPALSQHQKWCMWHILGEALRCENEGWYVPPRYWIRDWTWRADASEGGNS